MTLKNALLDLASRLAQTSGLAATVGLDTTLILDAVWLQHWLPSEAFSPARPGTAPQPKPGSAGPQVNPENAPAPESTTPTAPQDSTRGQGGLFPAAAASGSGSRRGNYQAVAKGRPTLDARALAKALRPLGKRRPSRTRVQFDEAATSTRWAQTGLLLPQFVAVPEYWFDLTLLVEESGSTPFWQPQIDELTTLFERQVRHRSIQVLGLTFEGVQALARRPNGTACTPEQALNGPSVFALVVSDAQSPAWHDGRMGRLLQRLGKVAALAVVPLLPASLWPNTELGAPWLQLTAPSPGSLNQRLQQRGRTRGKDGGARYTTGLDEVLVPWAGLSPWSMHRLAAVLMGNKGAACDAAELKAVPVDLAPDSADDNDPQTLVENFRSVASEDALNLAVYLSTRRPLNLAVMQLIQGVMSKDVQPEALPLLWLCGLLRQRDPLPDVPAGRPHGNRQHRADRTYYEFAPGVAQLLSASLMAGEQARIDRAVWVWAQQQPNSTAADTYLVEHSAGSARITDSAMGSGDAGNTSPGGSAAPSVPPTAPPSPAPPEHTNEDDAAEEARKIIRDIQTRPPPERPGKESPPPSTPGKEPDLPARHGAGVSRGQSKAHEMLFRRVYISSTTRDMMQYRETVSEVIDELNKEYESKFRLTKSHIFDVNPTGELKTPAASSEGWVKEADWVVLVIGFWYGYVPRGLDCSITEHEYRTAIAAEKPLFVFKAGASGQTPNEYRALPREIEREDLRDHITPPEHKEKFEQFMKFVGANHPSVVFKNIDHFREKVKLTLRQRIDSELTKSVSYADAHWSATQVVEMQELRAALLPAIDSAKQLANLKGIHDSLHRIRQFGIRRWREEVLNRWPAGALPTDDTRLAFVEPMLEVTRHLAQIETRFRSLSPDWQARLGRLPGLVNHFNGGSSQLGEDRGAFVSLIDRFASRQQAAFSDTNATMQRCAAELARHHDQMISRGNAALKRPTLSPEEVTAMHDEMEQSLARHQVLQHALALHADWQRAHDRLQGVDDALDDDNNPEQRMAVTLAPAIDDLPEIETLARGATSLWTPGPAPQKVTGLVQQVVRNCTALRNSESADDYRSLRKSFDDLFFEVDFETLNIVNHSRDQALAFEHGLPPPPSAES